VFRPRAGWESRSMICRHVRWPSSFTGFRCRAPGHQTRAVPKAYPIARKILFLLPAETAHELAIHSLAHTPGFARRVLRSRYEIADERLQSTVFGVDFPNPVGLAAGFDKGAIAYDALGALGFGFVEVGTVTALAQDG